MNKSDPDLYRRMSEPFANVKEADAAIAAFFKDVYAIREKHRIQDVTLIVQVTVGRASMQGDAHIGSSLEELPMALRYAARAKDRNREFLRQLEEMS